jgi:hypothetical protein
MTRLSQIIAVNKGVQSDTNRQRDEALRDLAKAPQLTGISRTYEPRTEDGDRLPPESTNVQIRADEVLSTYAAALTRMFDVTLTREAANCTAAADVKLEDGTVLLRKVPVAYLLFLEGQLADLRAVLSRLPLLDPAEKWDRDEAHDCWSTPPVQTMRPKKIPRNHVVAEATAQHPAQVQVYMEDVPAGDWTTVKFSGAMPAARVKQLLARCAELQRAVKYAREEANAMEITDRKCGEEIFSWLLA